MNRQIEFLLAHIPVPALAFDKHKLIVGQNDKMSAILGGNDEGKIESLEFFLDVMARQMPAGMRLTKIPCWIRAMWSYTRQNTQVAMLLKYMSTVRYSRKA